MMKNNAFVNGSSVALAAIAKLNTTVGFLVDRREAVSLSTVGKAANPAYVWRRVFLKGRSQRP